MTGEGRIGDRLVFKPSPLRSAKAETTLRPAPAAAPDRRREDLTYFIPGALDAAPAPLLAAAPVADEAASIAASEAADRSRWLYLVAALIVLLIVLLALDL